MYLGRVRGQLPEFFVRPLSIGVAVRRERFLALLVILLPQIVVGGLREDIDGRNGEEEEEYQSKSSSTFVDHRTEYSSAICSSAIIGRAYYRTRLGTHIRFSP